MRNIVQQRKNCIWVGVQVLYSSDVLGQMLKYTTAVCNWLNASNFLLIPDVCKYTPMQYLTTFLRVCEDAVLLHFLFYQFCFLSQLDTSNLFLHLGIMGKLICLFFSSLWCWRRELVSTTCSSTSWRPEKLVSEIVFKSDSECLS